MPLTTVIIRKSALVGEYFVDGKPVTEVFKGQVCQMDSEHAKQAIERELVAPFETPQISYEVSLFEPRKMVLEIETKEEDRQQIDVPDLSGYTVVGIDSSAAGDGNLPDPEPAAVDPANDALPAGADLPQSGTRDCSGRRRRAMPGDQLAARRRAGA